MRLLNRLHQYQRLWEPSSGEPQQGLPSASWRDAACSERHIRTLLRQAQESRLAKLAGQPGRGKRGLLQFYKAPETLRNEMMEQALNKGQQQNALELAQRAGGALKRCFPLLGGQWQNDTPTPYSLLPSTGAAHARVYAGRAEQHLAGEIFSA